MQCAYGLIRSPPEGTGMTAPRNIVEVVEYTDPLCSVAWGAEPLFRRLRWRHGHRMAWRTVMGGLAGDLSKTRENWDRVGAAKPMSDYWKRVTRLTGMPYPKPMHVMLQSTDPAGRAFHAARLQSEAAAQKVLRRMRESIFLFGHGPQTPEEFKRIGAGVAGLDVARWLADLDRNDVAEAYAADWEEARNPNDFVRAFKSDAPMAGVMRHSDGRDRYDFPTLLFRGPGGEHTVPGWAPYGDYELALEATLPGAAADPRPDPTPAQALAEWGVLTAKELEVLCGESAAPPVGAIAYDWGDGLAYFSPAHAAAWGLNAARSAAE
jgi:protein-disulfide isomerase-like protein with CxxC motif